VATTNFNGRGGEKGGKKDRRRLARRVRKQGQRRIQLPRLGGQEFLKVGPRGPTPKWARVLKEGGDSKKTCLGEGASDRGQMEFALKQEKKPSGGN